MLPAMRIEFLKMQGLGNDFLVFDEPPAAGESLGARQLRALADRHTGVGFDQALMLGAAREPGHRASYRIFNADGAEVEQCGNGARCIAALLYSRAPERGREMTLESAGGLVHARILEGGLVSVEMGIPNFEPASLPMDWPARATRYSLELEPGRDAAAVEFGAVSIGNPHAVLRVTDVATAPLERLGSAIQRHARFPQGVNVGFMQIVDRGQIRLRVLERGVGETRACGTGACAAAAVGRMQGLLDAEVRVELPGGTAQVTWPGEGRPIWLTGPAQRVFAGQIEI